MAIVYILISKGFSKGYSDLKIGQTTNLENRIRTLSNKSSAAYPYECYYAVKVDDQKKASDIEKMLHKGLDHCRVKVDKRRREFFNIDPEEAKSLLKIVEVMGGQNVTPTSDTIHTHQNKQALDNAGLKRPRSNIDLSRLGIKPGTELQFKGDETITCEVINNKNVKFRGTVTSLSASAGIVCQEKGLNPNVSGSLFWCFNGKTLNELRSETEN